MNFQLPEKSRHPRILIMIQDFVTPKRVTRTYQDEPAKRTEENSHRVNPDSCISLRARRRDVFPVERVEERASRRELDRFQ